MVPGTPTIRWNPGCGDSKFGSARKVNESTPRLTKMLSSYRLSTRTPKASRPRSLRGFARVGLVVAGVIFLLNTALFPCCEVAAAGLGGHHSEVEHSEPPHHSPDAPCDSSISSGAALVVEHEVLTPERSPVEWSAVDAPFATSLTSVSDSAIIAFARASPPHSLRFYLRTQRLLI